MIARPRFHLPTPEGWRTETIPFPLGFAPELAYQGLEELRFAPGMFDPEAEGYFSYAFVWSLDEPLELDPTTLARDLQVYFEGLAAAVRASRKLPPLELELPGALRLVAGGLEGVAAAFDAFTAQAELTLNVRVHRLEAAPGRAATLFFALSPRPFDDPVWQVLEDIREGYRPEAARP